MASAGKNIAFFLEVLLGMVYTCMCGIYKSDFVFLYIGITISPENDLVVPLNTSGVFACKAESADDNKDLDWLIQFPGEGAFLAKTKPDELDQRGIVVNTTYFNSTLSISGLRENNNTDVHCSLRGGHSQVVRFIVFGKYRHQFSEHAVG